MVCCITTSRCMMQRHRKDPMAALIRDCDAVRRNKGTRAAFNQTVLPLRDELEMVVAIYEQRP